MLSDLVGAARATAALGIPRTVLPHRWPMMAAAALSGGIAPSTLLALSAARAPKRAAVIDEQGTITAHELHRRVEKLAAALRSEYGIARGQRFGILCRNHRGYVEAFLAGSRLSAKVIPLNTDFAGPQLRDIVARDRIDVIVYDEEFHPVIEAAEFAGIRVLAKSAGRLPVSSTGQAARTIDELVALRARRIRRPAYGGSFVILTSGTTGTPKGAPRSLGLSRPRRPVPSGFDREKLHAMRHSLQRIARLKAIPRLGEPIEVCPPLHHLYGLIGIIGGLLMTSPIVLRERFDAEATLASIERNRSGLLLVVPVMMKRIMDVPEETRRRYDTSSLRVAMTGASALPPQLGTDFMDYFGDILFNGYASTEVGMGTLAYPEDLRAAPGTVGYPVGGLVQLRILDDDGKDCPPGVTGRLFNKNPTNFTAYTDGSGKRVIDGFMETGDVGHFDGAGRLFIDGRDDDMIVSGGENVFPQEVEELILRHESVADAGVVGVPDDEFGARLAAFVVRKDGAKLTADELKAYVRNNLARYKVPRDVTFVDTLPRTASGKLKRKALATEPMPGQ